jgi:hypothetical protein
MADLASTYVWDGHGRPADGGVYQREQTWLNCVLCNRGVDQSHIASRGHVTRVREHLALQADMAMYQPTAQAQLQLEGPPPPPPRAAVVPTLVGGAALATTRAKAPPPEPPQVTLEMLETRILNLASEVHNMLDMLTRMNQKIESLSDSLTEISETLAGAASSGLTASGAASSGWIDYHL